MESLVKCLWICSTLGDLCTTRRLQSSSFVSWVCQMQKGLHALEIFVQIGLRCQAGPGNNEFILHRLLNSGTKPLCDQSQDRKSVV